MRRNQVKPSEVKRKIETDRGVGSCRYEKKLEEVDRSGQKWSEMKILDFIFHQEYLHHLRQLFMYSANVGTKLVPDMSVGW